MKKFFTLLIFIGASMLPSRAQSSDTGSMPPMPGCQAAFYYYSDAIIANSSSSSIPYMFEDQSSGDVVSYSWDFGDGTTSRDSHPVHYYTRAGDTVNVCLTILTSDSCQSSICERLVTGDWIRPTDCNADFSIEVMKSLPPVYRFIPAKPDSLALYFWDFGDGTFSYEMLPLHTYEFSDLYVVGLFYTSADSCTAYRSDTIRATGSVSGCRAYFSAHPAFVYDNPIGSVNDSIFIPSNTTYYFQDLSKGNVSQWSWDFGDGTKSTEQNPMHQYNKGGNYNVCLQINTDSCESRFCKDIYIEEIADSCNLTGTVRDFSGLDGCGLLIVLDDSTVIEPAEIMVPDFVLYDGQRVRLSYTPLNDRFGICMRGIIARIDCISEIFGDSCTAEFTHYPLPWISSWPPIYKFEPVMYYDIIETIWDFGDGIVTNEFSPNHRYEHNGYYTVCLTVFTSSGCKVTACETSYYEGYGPEPALCNTYIKLNTEVILNGQTCNGSATATLVDEAGNQAMAVEYLWSTGDAGPSIYNLCPGSSYNVIIIDSAGCAVSGSFSFGGGYAYPDSLFGYWNYQQDNMDFFFSLPVFADDLRCEWDFGDGEVAEGNSVSHSYDSSEIYNVVLKIFDSEGNLLSNQNILVSPGEPLALKNTELKNPYVYPVPATERLFLSLSGTSGKVKRIEVYTAGGQLLNTYNAVNQESNLIELNVSDLPAGLYIGKLLLNNGRAQSFRFTK